MLISLLISLTIYFFSKDFLLIVNPKMIEYLEVLNLLIVSSLLGVLGSINSILLVSFE